MVSLNAYQVCSPAEALHTSQEGRSVSAHRASQLRRSSVWVLATWNVLFNWLAALRALRDLPATLRQDNIYIIYGVYMYAVCLYIHL